MNNEKVSDLKNKAEYNENESEAGKCPVCGNDDIEYGSSEIEDNYVKYEWTCPECSSEGNECGKIVFDGHYVDYSPFFGNEPKQALTLINVKKLIRNYITKWSEGVKYWERGENLFAEQTADKIAKQIEKLEKLFDMEKIDADTINNLIETETEDELIAIYEEILEYLTDNDETEE